ncbi:Predicted protein [Komagataella phaffii CBS 7435]|nr:Predicted protein [Komagataella phaffii CBS 7435]
MIHLPNAFFLYSVYLFYLIYELVKPDSVITMFASM